MTANEQDFLIILQNRMGNGVQIQPAHLGKASIQIPAGSNRDVVKVLLETDKNAGISAITGLDLGEKIGLMYHIRTNGVIVTISTELPKDNPLIPSITDLIPGANFHEREVADLFGVIFQGHPSPGRLVLPEDWPENLYPLRKDAKIDEVTTRPATSSFSKGAVQPEGESKLVNIIVGPQHPALLEPEKFSVKVDGEIVRDVEPRIGYVHRGVEKASEQRTYLQDVYLGGENLRNMQLVPRFMLSLKRWRKFWGLKCPPEAKYLRTIILELNRLHSHLLLLGHAGLEIGYETLFQYMWRDREPIMDLTELLTGNRVIASSLTVGGVRRDLKETDVPKIKTQLVTLRKRMDFYQNLYAKRALVEDAHPKRRDAVKRGRVKTLRSRSRG